MMQLTGGEPTGTVRNRARALHRARPAGRVRRGWVPVLALLIGLPAAGLVLSTPAWAQDSSGTPAAPTIEAGDGRLTVTWEVPDTGDTPILRYIVEYASGEAPWKAWQPAEGPVTATTTTIGGLVNGVSYRVRITAVTSEGGGEPSRVATATPRAAASTAEHYSPPQAKGGRTPSDSGSSPTPTTTASADPSQDAQSDGGDEPGSADDPGVPADDPGAGGGEPAPDSGDGPPEGTLRISDEPEFVPQAGIEPEGPPQGQPQGSGGGGRMSLTIVTDPAPQAYEPPQHWPVSGTHEEECEPAGDLYYDEDGNLRRENAEWPCPACGEAGNRRVDRQE